MSSTDTKKFNQEYTKLKDIAESMRKEEIDDIDVLIEKVKEGTASYQFCKTRLDEAEKSLKKILGDDAISEKSADQNKTKNHDSGLDDFGENIPF